MEAYA